MVSDTNTTPEADAVAQAQEESLRRMATAGRYNQWLLERARPYLGRRILDAGAGTGTLTEMVREGRDLVLAVEPDPGFAAMLRGRFDGAANVRVIEADVTELDATALPEPVDTVVCFNVLEHIEDDEAALTRFGEFLAPSGRLLLLVPAHPRLYGPMDRVLAHCRRYDKPTLGRRLRAAGLEVEDLRFVNPLGAVGWLVAGRLLRNEQIPRQPLALYDRLVPLLRAADAVELPFGLSLWAVARKP